MGGRRFFGVFFFSMLVACSQSTRRLDDEGADGDADGDGDGDSSWCVLAEMEHPRTNQVDMLFVIDNTGGMEEELNVLSEQIVILLQELIAPSDPDAWYVVDDLHVGVVTTDMGTYGHELQTCEEPWNGDDGVLQNDGRLTGCEDSYSAPDCTREECPWLVHSAEHPDDGTEPGNPPIWEDFGCIASLFDHGCGFEQHLEASYAALVERTRPGGPNEGFLRDDSIVAVVYVTTEDDCSTPDPDMFDPYRDDLGSLNVRCVLNPDRLHPVERYVDALRGLRPGREDLVMVSAIAGVPIDGSWNPGDPLERLRELQQINPSNPNELIRSCDTAMGVAFPPVRIAELVYAFGRNGVLESICRADWTPALQAVTVTMVSRLTGSCLSARVDAETLEQCRLIETLRDDRDCPHLADVPGPERTRGWQVDLGLDASGRRRCEVLRADDDGDGCPDGSCECEPDRYDDDPYAGCLRGWFFRPVDPPCVHGRVELTSRRVASEGSVLRFECFTETCPAR